VLSFTGFAVGPNADGRLELVAIAGDSGGPIRYPSDSGNVWHASQQTPNGDWSGWQPLDAPGGGVSGNAPALARNASGCLEVVVVANDGTVAYRAQAAASGPDWTAWETLRPLAGLAGVTPVLAQGKDGSLSVFVLQQSDMTVWQASHQPRASWSDWTPLGKPPGASQLDFYGMTAAANADGRLEVFAADTTVLWHRWQKQPGGTWSDWAAMPALNELAGADQLAGDGHQSIGRPVVVRDANGPLFVFTLPSDGLVRYASQDPHIEGGWSGWRPFTVDWFTGMGAGVNNENRMLVVAPTRENRLWQRTMFVPSWEQIGGASTYEYPGQLNRPALACNADGHLELFLMRVDAGTLYQFTQIPGTWPPQWSDGTEWPSPQ
jgi:hypothetical protein